MKGSTDGIGCEVYGFVVGETLFVIGGFLLSLGSVFGHWVPLLGIGLFSVGLLLAVMVFIKVSKSVSKAHSLLKEASIARQNDERRIKDSSKLLESQSRSIRKLHEEVQKTEGRINDVKRAIDLQDKKFRADFEKIFGHSSAFSRHNWANPLEGKIESLERRLKALEDAARDEKFRRSTGGWH